MLANSLPCTEKGRPEGRPFFSIVSKADYASGTVLPLGGPRHAFAKEKAPRVRGLSFFNHSLARIRRLYSMIFETTPAPTVRPPSRIAKRRPSSIAIGAISSTPNFRLSPGMTISVPSGS